MATCTFSMAPLYNDGNEIDYNWRLRVQGLEGLVGSTYLSRSDLTYSPSLTTGILSFVGIQGQTLVIEGRGHPGFANRIIFVVPSSSTYDLANVAEIAISTPPASGGVSFAIITGSPTDNDALSAALDLKANLASPTFTGTVTVPTPTDPTDAATKGYADSIVGDGGTWGSITGTLSAQTDLQAALDAKQASLGFTAVPNTRTVNGSPLSSNVTVSTITGNAGTATALATARAIYGNNFDGSAALTQIIASTFGGTGNGFTKLSGPASSEKTFTLPNASASLAILGAQTFTATQTFTPAVNTSALVASGYSLTGSDTHPLLDLSGTWNTSGVPTLIKANVTNILSDSGALLIDLQVGGVSKFSVGRNGGLIAAGSVTTSTELTASVSGSVAKLTASGTEAQIVAQGSATDIVGYIGSTNVFGANSSNWHIGQVPSDGFIDYSDANSLLRIGVGGRKIVIGDTDAQGNNTQLRVDDSVGIISINSITVLSDDPSFVVDGSAILQVDSTVSGFLPPRMTTTQKNAVGTPAEGLIVHDITTHAPNYYDGSAWQAVVNSNVTSLPSLATVGAITSGTWSATTIAVNKGGTGITSFGTGVATWLGTPSSANLRAALTDENGTGAALFDGATSPTFITPALGTPSALVLTSATGLPPTTGIVGWPSNASGVLTNDGSGTLGWAAGFEVDVTTYGASGATTGIAVNSALTTLASGAMGGATSITVTSATGFSIGDYITVTSAGYNFGEYQGRITGIAGTTFTVSPPIGSSVLSGVNVGHADASVRTTATGVSATSTSVTLADASTFSTGQGIGIPGAGSGGSWYVGTISNKSGSVLTITPAISTSVTNAWVMHDDTAAVRAARDAAALSKVFTLYFPAGIYNLNGAAEGASGSKGRLIVPIVDAGTDEWFSMTLKGPAQPTLVFGTVGGPYGISQHGAVLKTSTVGESLIGGSNTAGNGFTVGYLTIQDLTLRTYDNPQLTALNAKFITNLAVYRTAVESGTSGPGTAVTLPSLTSSVGIVTPGLDNGAYTVVRDSSVVGYYIGISANEHSVIDNLALTFLVRGLELPAGAHAVNVGRICAQHVNYPVYVSGAGHLSIDQLDTEHGSGTWATVADLYDNSNVGKGRIVYHAQSGTFTQTGGTGFVVDDLNTFATMSGRTLVTPTIASFVNAVHGHTNAAGGGTLAEAALALTDITTANVSTSAHGFTPKLPNDASKYLDGTGVWSVPGGGGGGGTGGNPTASVGLAAVNGSASTFLRSDGAPALDVTIAPTWSGAHTFTNSAGVVVSNTAPKVVLTDTTSSAKSLTIAVDSNIADFRESAGGSGSGLMIDLASPSLGFGTATPHVVASATLSGMTLNVKNSAAAADIAVQGNGSAAFEIIDTNASANQKWLQIISSAGVGSIRVINDAANSIPFTFFTLNMSTGTVTVPSLAGTGTRAVLADSAGLLSAPVSDARLKLNVRAMSDEMDIWSSLDRLRGVYFNWDTKQRPNLGEQQEIGFIAQEVEQVLPELTGSNRDGFMYVRYPEMTAFLLEAVKGLAARIEVLEGR